MEAKTKKNFFKTQLFSIIKIVLVLLVMVFLYAFSGQRNNTKKLTKLTVSFEHPEQLLLSEKTVNNLLIQNKGSIKNIKKEALNLNTLEATLNKNPFVRKSNIYVSVNGEVGVHVLQKKPQARVHTNETFYIDEKGKKMPISSNFSVRVPLVTGNVTEKNMSDVFKVVQAINSDSFFKQEIEGIIVTKNKYTLLLREYDFVINYGTSENGKLKIKNFKSFYQKAKKDKTLNKYSIINLQVASQVICTKK